MTGQELYAKYQLALATQMCAADHWDDIGEDNQIIYGVLATKLSDEQAAAHEAGRRAALGMRRYDEVLAEESLKKLQREYEANGQYEHDPASRREWAMQCIAAIKQLDRGMLNLPRTQVNLINTAPYV